MKTIDIHYRFAFSNGTVERFNFQLNGVTLRQEQVITKELPDWTCLEFCQCPNCPLDAIAEPRCPLAVDVTVVVEKFNRLLSYDHTWVTVKTKEREVSSKTTVQRGLSSLLGLLMATSGCPMTDFFKPMARFHLPFSSMNETIWRAVSTYLMAAYFMHQKDRHHWPAFEKLTRIYENIRIVNLSFAERLRSASQHDSMVNALVLLDMFAKCIPPGLEEALEQMRPYFMPLLKSYKLDD